MKSSFHAYIISMKKERMIKMAYEKGILNIPVSLKELEKNTAKGTLLELKNEIEDSILEKLPDKSQYKWDDKEFLACYYIANKDNLSEKEMEEIFEEYKDSSVVMLALGDRIAEVTPLLDKIIHMPNMIGNKMPDIYETELLMLCLSKKGLSKESAYDIFNTIPEKINKKIMYADVKYQYGHSAPEIIPMKEQYVHIFCKMEMAKAEKGQRVNADMFRYITDEKFTKRILNSLYCNEEICTKIASNINLNRSIRMGAFNRGVIFKDLTNPTPEMRNEMYESAIQTYTETTAEDVGGNELILKSFQNDAFMFLRNMIENDLLTDSIEYDLTKRLLNRRDIPNTKDIELAFLLAKYGQSPALKDLLQFREKNIKNTVVRNSYVGMTEVTKYLKKIENSLRKQRERDEPPKEEDINNLSELAKIGKSVYFTPFLTDEIFRMKLTNESSCFWLEMFKNWVSEEASPDILKSIREKMHETKISETANIELATTVGIVADKEQIAGQVEEWLKKYCLRTNPVKGGIQKQWNHPPINQLPNIASRTYFRKIMNSSKEERNDAKKLMEEVLKEKSLSAKAKNVGVQFLDLLNLTEEINKGKISYFSPNKGKEETTTYEEAVKRSENIEEPLFDYIHNIADVYARIFDIVEYNHLKTAMEEYREMGREEPEREEER